MCCAGRKPRDVKQRTCIDVVIGPQSYHKINHILNNFQINKKRDETEFDTISKFDFLEKQKTSTVMFLHF